MDHYLTMDQVTMTDFDGTLGIGGYRYGLVIAKVKEDYWACFPLHTLDSNEGEKRARSPCPRSRLGRRKMT